MTSGAAQRVRHCESVLARQAKINEHHLRTQGCDCFEGLATTGRCANHSEVFLLRQQGNQSLPEQAKVVHNENSNGLAH